MAGFLFIVGRGSRPGPQRHGRCIQHLRQDRSYPHPVSGVDREARVLRYREKRKNRKFEKTIRYASRKAYAETRPRIKGRFAKRSELEVDSLISGDASYGVVPTF
ncbi:UNVERIFIED_CONTAM: Zinc finger protein CONSTANS-LIKE 5 [Sesamum radiatum]|uniref:Zinc finger protein CONSTANS-LIKE 5 n=1 Tax=Sesamum radiatum TaxID=300843 RepID=A0AAW2JV75_SESRA